MRRIYIVLAVALLAGAFYAGYHLGNKDQEFDEAQLKAANDRTAKAEKVIAASQVIVKLHKDTIRDLRKVITRVNRHVADQDKTLTSIHQYYENKYRPYINASELSLDQYIWTRYPDSATVAKRTPKVAKGGNGQGLNTSGRVRFNPGGIEGKNRLLTRSGGGTRKNRPGACRSDKSVRANSISSVRHSDSQRQYGSGASQCQGQQIQTPAGWRWRCSGCGDNLSLDILNQNGKSSKSGGGGVKSEPGPSSSTSSFAPSLGAPFISLLNCSCSCLVG